MGRRPDNHLNTLQLRQKGWTDGLIKRFLPAPDKRTYYRAREAHWYRSERVEAIEQTEEFREALAAAKPRKEAAARAVKTKREALVAEMGAVPIDVPELERDELIRRACDHYNERNCGRPGWEVASPGSPLDFLARHCVNYLRHACTPYDAALAGTAGRTGKGEAYVELKTRVLEAIEELYEWLADECRKQIEELDLYVPRR